jgi:hypothetical protein
LLRAGARHVLELSKIPVAGGAAAELHMNFDAALEDAKEGKRGVRVLVRVSRATGTPEAAAEFKTTTSEPVDDKQWEAIGEGAAYRVLDHLLPLRARRSSLRFSESIDSVSQPRAAADRGGETAPQAAPLKLREELILHPAAATSGGLGDRK